MADRKSHRWTLVGPLGQLFLWVLFRTCRISVAGEERYRRIREARRPVIFLIWHGRLLMIPFFFRRRNVMALVSPSKDGEMVARIMDRWGFKNVRGSGSHAMAKAWEAMIRELRAGGELIIVPDGPRGPNRILKMGCIKLARQTGAALVPVAFSASRAKILKSWDHFLLIRPFSRILAVYGPSPSMGSGVGEEELEADRKRVEEACLALEKEADEAVLRPKSTGPAS